MKKNPWLTVRPVLRVAALVALLAGTLQSTPDANAAAASAPGPEARVIVKYRAGSATDNTVSIQQAQPGASAAAQAPSPVRMAAALSQRHGLTLTDGRTLAPRTQLVLGGGLSSEALARRLAADPAVEYAEADRRVRIRAAPNDPLYGTNAVASRPAAGQWYLRAPDSTLVSAINAEGAWDVTTGSAGIVVAVLDTGVRPDHPDLVGKLLPGYDFVSDANIGNDGDGRDGDPSDPGDWVSAADITSGRLGTDCTTDDIQNSSWHGTQTAGLVGAATNNGLGMAGTGRNVQVLPLRVLGKCGGYVSDVLDAMRWAAGLTVSGVPVNAHPARVINLSLGGAGACGPSYADVITTLKGLNVAVVVAAGNGNDIGGIAVDAPGNCAGAITVAGLRHSGTKVGYSNLGPEVALSAPAGNCVNSAAPCLYPIVSSVNTGVTAPVAAEEAYTNAMTYAVGTSFSAPMVAGTVALILSANPNLTVDQVRALLQQQARAFPTSGGTAGTPACVAPSGTAQLECYCTTQTCGAGMLDVRASVLAAAQAVPVAHLGTYPPRLSPGSTVVLDGSLSRPSASGLTLTSYQWEILDGSTLATVTPTGTSATATLVVAAGSSGQFTVRLTVRDSSGLSASATQLFTVADAVSVATPPAATGGSGGGGALDFSWLALATLSALGLRHLRRQRRG
ncbi:MAG: S8 family serine peptidase [Burkholderiales bacterium]